MAPFSQTGLAHVLLTKFNVPMQDDARHLDIEWIARRIDLLERHAAPSVHLQTAPFDGWLLLCDCDTPLRGRQLISAAAERTGCSPIWLERGEGLATVGEHLRALIEPTASHLLTSRLDSDDALHRDFSRAVRSSVVSGFVGYINPLLGLHYLDAKLYIWPYFASNFISYVAPLDGARPRTVVDISHDEIYRRGRVRQIVTRPLWLVVTHGANTSTIRQRGIRIRGRHASEFPLLARLEIEPDPSPPVLTARQAQDFARLAWKALRGQSRQRVIGGLMSAWSQLSERHQTGDRSK